MSELRFNRATVDVALLVRAAGLEDSVVDAIDDAVRRALRDYRCQHHEGLELADVFTPEDAEDISEGQEEVALLQDAIMGRIADLWES